MGEPTKPRKIRVMVPVRDKGNMDRLLDPDTECVDPEAWANDVVGGDGTRGAWIRWIDLGDALGKTVLIQGRGRRWRLYDVFGGLRLVIPAGATLEKATAAVKAMPRKVDQVQIGNTVYSRGWRERGWILDRMDRDLLAEAS